MAVPIQSTAFNPISGVFGIGQVQIFSSSGTWTVPPGVARVRARCFGGGGGIGGGGGGFAIKTVYDLTGISSVAVTIGSGGNNNAGGTSSFGSYCSATGGGYSASTGTVSGGTGVGGDINTNGGTGYGSTGGGGGVGSLFGVGGNNTNANYGATGASGAGGGNNSSYPGGSGILGSGAGPYFTNGAPIPPTSGMQGGFSIDFIGTGGGGSSATAGINGGGGGNASNTGGYPGGGGGTTGGAGMVIVEW